MKTNILIATYNRVQSLKRTLNSLQTQSDPEQVTYDAIIADNGSTDETQAIIQELAQQWGGRIRYLYEGKKGKAYALNRGLQIADGEVVAFTDDDTTVKPEWLKVIYENFKNQTLDCVTGKIIPDFSIPSTRWYSPALSTVLGNVDYAPQRGPIPWAAGSNMAARRVALEKVKGFSYCQGLINEDTILSQKMIRAGLSMFYDPNMIVYHHFQPEKFNKAYFRRWYVLSGRAIAEIKREEESAMAKKLLQIPFWRYRLALNEIFGYITNVFSEPKRFYHELQSRRFAGFCLERWFGKSVTKVAFVNTEFLPVPPVKGGAVEEWIDQMAYRLSGYEVDVFSIYDSLLPVKERKRHVGYWRFKPGILSRILLSTYKLPFKQSHSKLFYFPYSLWAAFKIFRGKTDIIHIHNRPHFVWIMRRLNPQAKIILHIHQVSALEEKKIWDENLWQNVDLFVGCSRFIIRELQDRYPIAENKTAVAYNALHLKDFPTVWSQADRRLQSRRDLKLNTEEKAVLYVGRLAENKGAHLLLGAVKELIEAGHKNLKLIFCGSRGYSNREVTPYIQNLYDTAKAINDRILFAGYIPHHEIGRYYLASDLVVIPSEVAEGFCIVTIESMASGIPVIAGARGGIPEIIKDGQTGILVEKPGQENFRNAIEKFLNDPASFAQYARQGRREVEEKFTWEKISQSVENIYMRVLSNA